MAARFLEHDELGAQPAHVLTRNPSGHASGAPWRSHDPIYGFSPRAMGGFAGSEGARARAPVARRSAIAARGVHKSHRPSTAKGARARARADGGGARAL